jgi:hypothetical protein
MTGKSLPLAGKVTFISRSTWRPDTGNTTGLKLTIGVFDFFILFLSFDIVKGQHLASPRRSVIAALLSQNEEGVKKAFFAEKLS